MSRCDECKKYAGLQRPRKVDEQNYIYGFCFNDYHVNYGSTYPVYIPDGGVCKALRSLKVVFQVIRRIWLIINQIRQIYIGD